MVTFKPWLLKPLSMLPSGVLEPTATTLAQLAGDIRSAFSASLPAARTNTIPSSPSSSITSCQALVHSVAPPRLRFTTLTGVGLSGTPSTLRPALQRTASIMSASVPPQIPSALACNSRAFQSMPAMPCPLLLLPAATLETEVPCQLLEKPLQLSPGSPGSGSRPSPSLALKKSCGPSAETKSYPRPSTERFARSICSGRSRCL